MSQYKAHSLDICQSSENQAEFVQSDPSIKENSCRPVLPWQLGFHIFHTLIEQDVHSELN